MMSVAALLLIATQTAAAIADEDAPARVAASRINLTGDPVEIAACSQRLLGRSGSVSPYPLSAGAAFEWNFKGGLFGGGGGDPLMSFEFARDHIGAFATVRYRHPFSRGTALKVVRKAAKMCFRQDYDRWKTSDASE